MTDNNNDEEDISYIELDQFNLPAVVAATDNFAKDNKLGEGGFGEVFKVRFRSNVHRYPDHILLFFFLMLYSFLCPLQIIYHLSFITSQTYFNFSSSLKCTMSNKCAV